MSPDSSWQVTSQATFQASGRPSLSSSTEAAMLLGKASALSPMPSASVSASVVTVKVSLEPPIVSTTSTAVKPTADEVVFTVTVSLLFTKPSNDV